MKLYIANGSYYGTQADARKIDKAFELVEVPTDKEGLIVYLNEHCTAPIERVPDAEIVQRNDGEAQREATRRMAPIEGPLTLTNVEEFIQSAGHPQVVSIFENVVLRTRELVTAPPAAGSLQERMAAVQAEARDSKGRPAAPTSDGSTLAKDIERAGEIIDEIDPLA